MVGQGLWEDLKLELVAESCKQDQAWWGTDRRLTQGVNPFEVDLIDGKWRIFRTITSEVHFWLLGEKSCDGVFLTIKDEFGQSLKAVSIRCFNKGS